MDPELHREPAGDAAAPRRRRSRDQCHRPVLVAALTFAAFGGGALLPRRNGASVVPVAVAPKDGVRHGEATATGDFDASSGSGRGLGDEGDASGYFVKPLIPCLDPDTMPWTANRLHELQNRCTVEGKDTKYLLYNGFAGGIGLGASIRLTVDVMAWALNHGRVFYMAADHENSNSFFMDRCGKRNIFECAWEPVTDCPIPGHPKGPDDEDVVDVVSEDVAAHIEGASFKALKEHTRNEIDRAHDAGAQFIRLNQYIYNKALEEPSERIIEGNLTMANPIGYESAAAQFLLRPNAMMRDHIRETLEASGVLNVNPEHTISMPIRGSDKCDAESECPPFSQYMKIANEIRKMDPRVENIILTSEDPKYLEEYPEWQNGGEGRNWNFILDVRDVHQGTGGNIGQKHKEQLKHDVFNKGVGKVDVLKSMMGSLYMHMFSKYAVLNCHSNWHRLIMHMHEAGCTASSRPIALCVGHQDKLGIHQCAMLNGVKIGDCNSGGL